MYIASVSHYALVWGSVVPFLLSIMWHSLGALLPSIHISHGRPGTSSMQLCERRGFECKVEVDGFDSLAWVAVFNAMKYSNQGSLERVRLVLGLDRLDRSFMRLK